MSFEYFNNSHLAFGSKLTRAFKQLEKLMNDAEGNILSYVSDLDVLGEYINRNYRVPRPVTETSAVRAAEIFDVINDNYYIKEASYKDGIFRLSLNYFNRGTNRFTIASGSTDINEGYAYVKPSMSNSNPASEIIFSEKENNSSGYCIFKYRIDSQGFINIEDGSSDIITFKIGDYDYENNISFGDQITLPYTATDYCCVCVIGRKTSVSNNEYSLSISVNGQYICSSYGTIHKNSGFVYLKPEDILSSEVYADAYLINYTKE